MMEPLDVIVVFHNAFRREMTEIDLAARDTARGMPYLSSTIERIRFFNDALVWHADGEEQSLFPVIEAALPSVAEAYERDHRYLDAAYERMEAAVSAGDALETARCSAAFKFHLEIHLAKEEAHLFRVAKECIAAADQARILSQMAASIPQDRSAEATTWLFRLLGTADQETLVRFWQNGMPPPAFAQVKQVIQAALGADWLELVNRIPSLE